MSKATVIAEWKQNIATDDRWAKRALARIYREQTADEQASGATKHHNSVGFTGRDAEIGTDLARKLERGYQFSYKQMALIRKIMQKYAGQLYRLTHQEV